MSKQICIFTIRGVPFKSNMYFISSFSFSDEEQQENGHPGQRGERQEEAVPGVPAEHGPAAQTGDVRRHQEEV